MRSRCAGSLTDAPRPTLQTHARYTGSVHGTTTTTTTNVKIKVMPSQPLRGHFTKFANKMLHTTQCLNDRSAGNGVIFLSAMFTGASTPVQCLTPVPCSRPVFQASVDRSHFDEPCSRMNTGIIRICLLYTSPSPRDS